MTTTKVESRKSKVESQHTPGPWHVSTHDEIVTGGRARCICKVYTLRSQHAPDGEEPSANAHLIAAAPDLLAACKLALPYMLAQGYHHIYSARRNRQGRRIGAMKTQLTILACCLIAGSVQATMLDLGPNGKTFYRTYDYSEMNGTEFNGQTISIDLTFSTQVHLFSNTYPNFLIGLAFLTSGGESFITGTGYVTDINGLPMIGTGSVLGSANSTDLMFVGLFPNYYGLTRPADIYGVHFDITLPMMDGEIVAGGIELFDNKLPGRPGFRIGPHLPETGASLALLVVAMVGLFLFNCFVVKTK